MVAACATASARLRSTRRSACRRSLACEAVTADVRGHKRYCMRWPLDATPAARGCLWIRLRSATCGRPTCDRRLMWLPPTRDRPSARPGPSAVWPPLLHVRTLGAIAGLE
ncbi:hypothetical protein B296_00018613 [Ensete ventricosum]|uniref:Uncharacterized protein n=1 Tax=Ensete ventricosum TaxID=4639 RepID=A0A426Z4A4_ENSVE|nr:hypothetical protein B296_00018613 [Ensete ventricosum]